MVTKTGFHINSPVGITSPWIGKFKPKVNLLLALSIGGNVPQLIQLMQAYPDTHFIYRAWDYGSLGNSDHFESYYKIHGDNPEPLIKAHEPVFTATSQFHNRFSVQLWNETGHDRVTWPHFISFNTKFVKEMDARGLSASVLGLGPGHPAWDGGVGDARAAIREAWFQAKSLFEAIIGAQQTHLINLHEYHAVPYTRKDAAGNTVYMPWILGRYKWLLEDAAALGLDITKLKIVIGESGLTNPNSLNIPSPVGPNGYRWSLTQGYTPEQLAEDYVNMVNAVYEQDDHVLGTCYFSFGGGESGFWKEFDLLQEPRILERMLQMVDQATWTVVPTPDTQFKVVADALNVRFAPTLTGQIIGKKLLDEVVTSNGYVDNENIRWRQLVNSEGYCAEYNTSSGIVYLEEIVVPDWKTQALAKLEQIRQDIEEIKALISQAG